MRFTFKEIVEVTGAKLIWGEKIEGEFGISTDTRTINENEIYLPLRGENFDGHNFIDSAIEKGVLGYFTQDNRKINEKAKFVLAVKNSLIAYLELARYIRRKFNPKVVAITGSSGKTTVKEMMAEVLATTFKTHKSKLNHNNEIGLCQTLFAMPKDTEIVVAELGMRNLGEIELLDKYLEPDIGIITNIGTAHVERLGSVDNIASAKCEITNHLKEDGLFVANDNEKIRKLDNISVVRYGENMVDKMISAFSSIEKVTYGIVIALVLVTIFLIINTIKLTISARKREIGIMRLVGASNFTIKTPFIIEGMILGLFGSIVPVLITTYGYLAFYNHFDGYLYSELIKLIAPEPFIYTTSLVVIGIGMLVGMIGSAGAVKKYLKI